MKKIIMVFPVLLLLGLVAGGASAALVGITGTGTAGFQGWTLGALNQNGSPYWDGRSSDGNYRNIGYYLSGTGYFNALPAVSDPLPRYWGYGNGTADLNFYVANPTDSKVRIVLEIAGFAGTNRFGYYDHATGTRHELFDGADHAGDVAYIDISPGSSNPIGFYLQVFDNIYYTEAGLNATSAERGKQHFALFALSDGSYYVAAEDLSLGDKDYNDFVVRIRTMAVPEMSAGALFLSGVFGLIAYRRKKRLS